MSAVVLTAEQRTVVELAVDIIACGENHDQALALASLRLDVSTETHRLVLIAEDIVNGRVGWRSPDERVARLRRLLLEAIDAAESGR